MPILKAPGLITIIGLLSGGCATYPHHALDTAAASRMSTLAITNATVLDGDAQAPRRNMTVVVRGGRIASIAANGALPGDAGEVIDAAGRWLLPGFIDAHVHLRDLGSARAAVQAGVTTARSLGSDHFADVRIRLLHESGAEDVPEVVAAGYHVRRRVADGLFLDAPELYDLRHGVTGPQNVARVVKALAGRGVDAIKVMMTERAGLPDTDFRRRVLTNDEVIAAVVAARESSLSVAAHAHTDDGAAAAVEAGVRSIEHGTLLSRDTLAKMRDRGTCFVPTLSFWVDMRTTGGEYDHPALAERASEMLPKARAAAAQAVAMGVLVAAGSDMRYDGSSALTVADEAVELVNSGVAPPAAIRAATLAGAKCLGIESRTGDIAIGLEADLVLLDGDPLLDIRSLKNVVVVVNDGRVAVNRLR